MPTQITDVVVPEIFTDYTMEQSIYKSRFFLSNIISDEAGLSNLVAGGGRTFNIPFWQDVDHNESGIPVENTDGTLDKITASKQVGVRLQRYKYWGSEDMAKSLAGSDPMQAIADRVIGYWAQDYDKTLISIVDGVIADNIANDSSDLVNVTATAFDDDGVIDTQALLGENGTVGRGDLNNGDFVGIAVHPNTFALMRKNDLITFVPVSEQVRPIPMYMGMNVIVDRNLPVDGGVYTSIIFKSSAFGFGISGNLIVPTAVDRDEKKGMGQDQLFTRRNYIIHPQGFEYTGTSAGEYPTNTELANASSWSRVYEKENIGFCAYQHTLV